MFRRLPTYSGRCLFNQGATPDRTALGLLQHPRPQGGGGSRPTGGPGATFSSSVPAAVAGTGHKFRRPIGTCNVEPARCDWSAGANNRRYVPVEQRPGTPDDSQQLNPDGNACDGAFPNPLTQTARCPLLGPSVSFPTDNARCVRCRLRSSLTHIRVRSLRCSAPPSPRAFSAGPVVWRFSVARSRLRLGRHPRGPLCGGCSVVVDLAARCRVRSSAAGIRARSLRWSMRDAAGSEHGISVTYSRGSIRWPTLNLRRVRGPDSRSDLGVRAAFRAEFGAYHSPAD
jgi:hypothetical protein